MGEISSQLRIYRFVFQDALFDEHDYITEVDSTGANQHAFTAEHTFLNFRFELNRFATTQQQIHSPDIKANQIARTAGGSASATRQAYLERRLHFENFIQQPTVKLIVIDGALFNYCVSKVFHSFVVQTT
jgi:hypothetical protein